jgi:hypothetical protein
MLRAAGNIGKYGYQCVAELIERMVEELGEIARAHRAVKAELGVDGLEDMSAECRDLGALCLQLGLLCATVGCEPIDSEIDMPDSSEVVDLADAAENVALFLRTTNYWRGMPKTLHSRVDILESALDRARAAAVPQEGAANETAMGGGGGA